MPSPPLSARHVLRGMIATLLYGAPALAMAQDIERTSQAPHSLQSSVRLGTEHDNNAQRTTDEPEQDWLTRYFASLDMILRHPAQRSVTSISISQGGKLFLSERGANMLLTQAALSWQRRLPTKRLLLTRLTLDLKDRTERVSIQDYYRAGAAFGVGGRVFNALFLEARAGARTFAFKPNPAAGARGLTAAFIAQVQLPAQLSLRSQYSWTQRRFDIASQQRIFPADVPEDDAQIYLEAGARVRQDLFHAWRTSLGWQGPVLVNAHYTLSLNRSNSYGQDLQRHNAGLDFAAALPWDLFCAARLELQRTRYDDPVLLDANFSIDEDNRNMGTLSVVRGITKGWEAELRASLYVQEFGGIENYQRRTVMLALGHQLSKDFD